MVVAALAVEQVMPGRGAHVLPAINAIFHIRHICPHLGLDGRADVETYAVVEIGVPAKRMPFDYFEEERKNWKPVPPAAQKAIPKIAEILQGKVVPSPLSFLA